MSNKATENGEQLPATIQGTQLVRAADSAAVAEAVTEYKQIQQALDKAMPDCLMSIKGKQFRRKPYWRAVATAFNLTVEVTEEELAKGEKDWGYFVICRATAPNGRFSDGDGACFASEKQGAMRTVHNVRAHAHTRAYNRAVSNLVGFGEVSADELGAAAFRAQSHRRASQAQAPRRTEAPRTTPVSATPNYEVRCPKCQSPMWDNCERREQQQRDYDNGTRPNKPGPAWSCSENRTRERGHEFWTDSDRLKAAGSAPAIIEADVTEAYADVGPEEVF